MSPWCSCLLITLVAACDRERIARSENALPPVVAVERVRPDATVVGLREHEPNQDAATANEVTFSATLSGTLAAPRDVDCWRLVTAPLSAAERFDLTVEAAAASSFAITFEDGSVRKARRTGRLAISSMAPSPNGIHVGCISWTAPVGEGDVSYELVATRRLVAGDVEQEPNDNSAHPEVLVKDLRGALDAGDVDQFMLAPSLTQRVVTIVGDKELVLAHQGTSEKKTGATLVFDVAPSGTQFALSTQTTSGYRISITEEAQAR